MVREIVLANNKGIALVDDEDYEDVNKFKWHILPNGSGVYYAQTCERIKNGNKTIQKTVLMHRIIMKNLKNEFIDHINFNGLDNRKCNLRMCDKSNNCMYKRKTTKNKSSKYKGVTWHFTNRWAAQIECNNIHIHLGMFEKEDDAATAYNTKAVELFGEFSYLNKVVG